MVNLAQAPFLAALNKDRHLFDKVLQDNDFEYPMVQISNDISQAQNFSAAMLLGFPP